MLNTQRMVVMDNGEYKDIIKSIQELSGEVREFKGFIEASMANTNRQLEIHDIRINKREQEIDAVKEDVGSIKEQISGFKGQLVAFKVVGVLLGLLFAGLEAWRILNPM